MSQQEAVLNALKYAGHRGCTTAELMEAGGRNFPARVLELRNAGHEISTHRMRAGEFLYLLTPPASPVWPDDWMNDQGWIVLDYTGSNRGGPLRKATA